MPLNVAWRSSEDPAVQADDATRHSDPLGLYSERLFGTRETARRRESNIVDRHIRSLRIKLQNDYRHPRFIATVPGEGYRFSPTFSNQGWAIEQGSERQPQ